MKRQDMAEERCGYSGLDTGSPFRNRQCPAWTAPTIQDEPATAFYRLPALYQRAGVLA